MANWDLFREMETLTREMDHLFRGYGQGRAVEPSFVSLMGGRGYPRINLREDADNVYVDALLPGIDAKELEMTVLKNTLTLAGNRPNGSKEGVSWHRRERGTGRFMRTIEIPVDIEVEKVKADYQHGVLTVTMPKGMAAKPKRIEIKTK